MLKGAECVARTEKVSPYFHMNSSADGPHHDSELFFFCLCCLQGHHDPMSPAALFVLGTSSGAFLIWSLCAGILGLAAGADTAAYIYLLLSDKFRCNTAVSDTAWG
jgi:hypothetical protein